MLLQQLKVLMFDEQQSDTDERNSCQYSQRQTQAKDSLVSKSEHCISLL